MTAHNVLVPKEATQEMIEAGRKSDRVWWSIEDSRLLKLWRKMAAAAPIPEGFVVVPLEPTDEMVNAALGSTAVFHNIEGSALTVNREKMRIRWRAMLSRA